MNTSKLIEFMENCSDPLEHNIEQTFKNNKPDQDEDPKIAFRYWQMHMDIYGTPSNHMAIRTMYYNFKSMYHSTSEEMRRQTKMIDTLRQELKEAKARNTMYLSKIQEYEAREQ